MWREGKARINSTRFFKILDGFQVNEEQVSVRSKESSHRHPFRKEDKGWMLRPLLRRPSRFPVSRLGHTTRGLFTGKGPANKDSKLAINGALAVAALAAAAASHYHPEWFGFEPHVQDEEAEPTTGTL